MTMPPYPVLCYSPGCEQLACFKIAARWSDGVTHELKTYSLSCESCVAKLLAEAKRKQESCRLSVGETLESPGIFELSRGQRDRTLMRRTELEG